MAKHSWLRKALATAAVTAAVTAGLLVDAAPAQAAFTSARGGAISREEVIQRAQYWLYNQPGPYNGTWAPGPNDLEKIYRLDCSGYVDMVWHLKENNTTHDLDQVSTEIRRADLRPGDILNDAAEHVIIFNAWEPDHIHFSYYSFGSTPVKFLSHQSINQSYFDSHPNGAYVARRYVRIIDDRASGRAIYHDGYSSVFTVNSSNGHLVESYLPYIGAPWAWHDLSTMAGTPATNRAPATLQHDGYTSVFTVNSSNGHLVETFLPYVGAPWASHDLSAMAGTPAVSGTPVVVYHDGYTSVFTVNLSNYHLSETYLPYIGAAWTTHDLSAMAGTPGVTGSPAVVYHDGFTSVFTVNYSNHHLSETYLPFIGAAWYTHDLSAMAGTPVVAGSPAVVDHDGFTSVFTMNELNGHLEETYLPYIGAPWNTQDLSAMAGTPSLLRSPVVLVHDGRTSVFTVNSTNRHLTETYLARLGTSWAWHDLSTTAGTPTVSGDPAVLLHDRYTSVFTRGSGGHLMETFLPYIGSPWYVQDLSANFGTPPSIA